MITVVYFEADHLHALELIAKAVTFSESVYALCENGGSCVPALSAGASKAVVIGLIDDDCAQGDHIASVIGRMHADSVLFPATIRGRFLSAWVAARLQTGLTADCTGLDVTTDDLLLQIRPAFGGESYSKHSLPFPQTADRQRSARHFSHAGAEVERIQRERTDRLS